MMRLKHKYLLMGSGSVVLVFVILAAVWYGWSALSVKDAGGEQVEPVSEETSLGELVVTEDPLSVSDFSLVDVSVSPGRLVLASNCSLIAMTTTTEKTQSIQRGKMREQDVRPNEHDVLHEVMAHYGVDVVLVKVHGMNEDVYYADLIMKNDNRLLSVDVKPSDAIAVAERFGAPVYVKTDILESVGQDTCA